MSTEEIILPPETEPKYRLFVPVSEYMGNAVIEEGLTTVEDIARAIGQM